MSKQTAFEKIIENHLTKARKMRTRDSNNAHTLGLYLIDFNAFHYIIYVYTLYMHMLTPQRLLKYVP